MVINSVLSTGIDGIKTGMESAQNAARDIAGLNTSNNSAAAVNEAGEATNDQGSNSLDTLTEAIVDMNVAERQVQASAAVVKTADEMLGTMVDIKV